METRSQRISRFTQIFSSPLAASGLSQKQLAAAFGVSNNTIQSYLRGSSFPDFDGTNRLLATMGANPARPYLNYLFPAEIGALPDCPTGSQARRAMCCYLSHTTPTELQLLYQLMHTPDIDWQTILGCWVMDAHLPMDLRVATATQISDLYEALCSNSRLISPSEVMPDISLVRHATSFGLSAVLGGSSAYTVLSDAPDHSTAIAEIVRTVRPASISQATLAADLGIKPRTLRNWELGTTHPDLFELTELFLFCGKWDAIWPTLYAQIYPAAQQLPADQTDARRADLLSHFSAAPDAEAICSAFLVFSANGGSFHCMLHKAAAYTHLLPPLRESIRRQVISLYDMASAQGRTVCPDFAPIDTAAFRRGELAIL